MTEDHPGVPPEHQHAVAKKPDKLPIVAYKGGFELLDAKWELQNGRTVKFRIMEEPNKPILMHPFNQFTRRRGGRVGTRFGASITHEHSEEPMFVGEMMLMSGGAPLGKGYWVSFWLDDEADHHPFAGYRPRKGDAPGEIFMVAFCELDDDDHVINQEKRARVESANGKRGRQKLSNFAALLCENEMFHQYLHERVTFSGKQIPKHKWASEDMAARYIRWKCGIESRSELDRDERAIEIFHKEIREPYRDWRSTHE